MSNKNDPFKIYNPVLKDIERQQQMIRDMVRPIEIMQQSISNMTTSVMQPYIDQHNQFCEQISSVLQPLIDQQTYFREQMLSVTTTNFSHALTTFNFKIKDILSGISASDITRSLTQLTSLSECIATMDYEDISETSTFIDENINLIVDSNLITEEISIEQMYDMLTDNYSDDKEYNSIDSDEFIKKVDNLDFINNDNSLVMFHELTVELRRFNDNKEASNKLSYKIIDQVKNLIAKGFIVVAIYIIYLYIGYSIENNEIVQKFLDIFSNL